MDVDGQRDVDAKVDDSKMDVDSQEAGVKVIDMSDESKQLNPGDDGYIDVMEAAPQKTWSALNLADWCKTTKLSRDHVDVCAIGVDMVREAEAKYDAMVEEASKRPDVREGVRNKPDVYVRVRPASKNELKQSTEMVEGLKLETDIAEEKGDTVLAMPAAAEAINGVLGTECDNANTFKNTLGKHLDIMIRGGSVSVFAYGHSGTGKTHTTLGYREEPGLFKLACAELFKAIDERNKNAADSIAGKLMLQVRFSELYLGRAYDLLNKREELLLREDERGEVHLRGQTVRHADGRAETRDQVFRHVRDLDHLLEILDDGIKMRAVGSSNIHDQSSRSHAMLEMELVSEGLIKAREDLVVAKGNIVPIDAKRQMLEKRCASLLHYSPLKVKMTKNGHNYGEGSDFTDGGDTSIYEVFFVTMMRVAHFHNMGICKMTDIEDWFKRHCDIPYGSQESYMNYITNNPAYSLLKPYWKEMEDWWTVEGWLKGFTKLQQEAMAIFEEYAVALPKILDAKERIKKVEAALDGHIGGVLTLVDLAGADHDTRDLSAASKQELAESAQINSELATLKGVMSGLAKNTRRLPWRDQKLTMVLKRVLMPPAGGDTQPIMIACVSPSITQERDTTNTLRYAQMVTGVVGKKKAVKRTRKPATRAPSGMALAAIKEIRGIYAKYCPEKTEADVNKILSKFKGRERMLLAKMEAKYGKVDATDEKAAEPDAEKAAKVAKMSPVAADKAVKVSPVATEKVAYGKAPEATEKAAYEEEPEATLMAAYEKAPVVGSTVAYEKAPVVGSTVEYQKAPETTERTAYEEAPVTSRESPKVAIEAPVAIKAPKTSVVEPNTPVKTPPKRAIGDGSMPAEVPKKRKRSDKPGGFSKILEICSGSGTV